MAIEHIPSANKVAELYDEITTVQAKLWNGNLHYGYWHDDDDGSTFEEAVNQMTEQVIQRLDPQSGQLVLDVGCGIGSPALKLAHDHSVQITGISISPRQIALANERAREEGLSESVRFETADAMSMPYADNSFDAVLALESMAHMPDKTRVLTEIARVLRPGGRLALADVALTGLPANDRGDKPAAEVSTSTYSMARIDEYSARLEEAGLVVLDVTDISEHTRRSVPCFVSSAESCRDEYVRAIGLEEFERRLEEGRRLEWTQEIGYVLISAERPRANC